MTVVKLLRFSLLASILVVYAIAGNQMNRLPRVSKTLEMQVALPLFVQVGLAGGDRYLAANLAGFRALVVEPRNLQKDELHVLARVQRDVAWLNPAHEDNYYIATAILPWNGELESTQYILKRAVDARPFDWQPIFYYAFHIYYFDHDPALAAKWLLTAVPRARNLNDRFALQNLAARWFEKGYDPRVAVNVVTAMAEQSQSSRFKQYLETRVARLQGLIELQDAARQFREQTGRPLHDLQELVQSGLIQKVPKDPFGFGYALNVDGEPMLLNAPNRK